MRHDARECAFKLIFETLFKDREEETKLEVTATLKKDEDIKFCEQIFDAYLNHQPQLEAVVSENLKNFELSRVYKIDLALTYLALTEINFCQTPKAVAINEALEIAKKYSTNQSAKFINGLLSAIMSER